jgi:protein-S-isoprenylcysteine O-methyltransferase Ste14
MSPKEKRPSATARAAVLAYGTIVYVFFLGVFLYAVGFVTGVGVPKGIDDGPEASLAVALLVNGGILALFAVQHMVMARRWFKRRWTKIVPPAAERSTFVLATCAILTLLFVEWRPLPGAVWSVGDPIAATVLRGISFLGFGIVLVATFLIDHFDLFGLKQVIRFFRGTEHRDPEFRVRSFYRYVRHPLYLGFLLGFWATPVMTVGHLVFALGCTGFILVAVRFEERDLVALHGDAYERYREEVPMIFPRPGRTSAPVAVETA